MVGTTLALAPTAAAAPDGSGLVISEAYGGGGNSGAVYNADFIEIHNPTDAAIDLSGKSLQYRSAAGTGTSNNVFALPVGASVPAGGYYVVKGQGGANGVDLPVTPDATAGLNLSGSGGQIYLADSAAGIDPGTGAIDNAQVIDFLGWGSSTTSFETAKAPATTNSTSSTRDADNADTDDNSADFISSAPTPGAVYTEPEPPTEVEATIAEVQGTGPASPLVGDIVTTQGVVTAAYNTGGLNGVYIQTGGTGGATDATPGASDAVFVYGSAVGAADLAIGDSVEVTGPVSEFSGTTEITPAAGGVTQLETALPEVTALVTAYPTTETDREAHEGELLAPTDDFTVTNTYATNQYAEIGLATGNKPLIQWTDVARPGTPEADAVKADNAARGVILDDGASLNFFNAENQGTPLPWLSKANPIRVGAAATLAAPVILEYRNNNWKFQPTSPVTGSGAEVATFENTRTPAPEAVAGDLHIATFNVLNYFNTLGVDWAPGCTFYTDRAGDPVTDNRCEENGPRGAAEAEDLQRQQDKIVAAINALGADVVSLEEIENSVALGETDRDDALSTLVDALNAAAGSDVWAFAPSPDADDLPPVSDQDVIRTAFIYKVASVELVGASEVLVGDPIFDNAREPLAQAFKPAGADDSAAFAVVVNHFKSKGSGDDATGDNVDTGDGQGAWNGDRVRMAGSLVTFANDFAADRGTEKVFLTGDFNSYSQEDPMQALYDAGFTAVESDTEGESTYSFSGLSGSLDHVLANDAALETVQGADIWNINSGESVAFEYSRHNYNVTDFYEPNVYRSSDHDPEIVGISTDDTPAEGQVTLNLLGVNDFHGRINDNTVKWAGTVEELTEQGGADSTLMVGAGDLIGASEFASAVDGDQPTIDVMNALGLDASAVGNHEFDKGWADLRDRVIGPDDARNAQWDYLGANVYAKGTTDPVLPEFATFEVDGVTVGVVGAVTEETASLVSPAGIADIEFGDPVDAVNRVAGELSDGDDANGEADVIIASFHAGATQGVGSSYEEEVAKGGEFAEMANLDAAVDVIFNGHTHQTYAWDAPVPGEEGASRPIIQTGQYADNVGQVSLTVDSATGDVVSYEARNVARTTEDDAVLVEKYPRVAQVKQVVDAALAHAAEIGNQPVGEITGDISRAKTPTGGEDRGAESTVGDLVGNALRDGLPSDFEADLGLVNPGGLRADLLFAGDTSKNPANTNGVVTFAEANSVLPFVNNVSLVDLTGAQLRAVLEQQWQPDGSSRPFLALGLSDNVRVTQDPTKPRGERITSVIIDGQMLDPTATYTVSTFSFLASGGDNFFAFKDGVARDTGLVDRELWMSYLESHQPLSPDFARQQVVEHGYPGVVFAGQEVSFDLSNLDLTSLGSPANTEVRVFLTNGTDSQPMGSFPVTNGAATVAFTAPADLEGMWTVGVIADPSFTQVGLPLPAVDTTLTAEGPAEPVTYGSKGLVVATLDSANPSTGQVELLLGDQVVGTGTLTGGTANIRFDSTKLEMGTNQLTVRYSGDEQNNPSETTVQVEVVKATPELSTTLSTDRPVVKADSIVVTTNVATEGYTATGYVVLYVDGMIRTLANLEDGTAEMGVTPLDTVGEHTIQVAYFGDDHTKVAITNDTVTVVKAKPSMTVKVKPRKIHVKKTRATLVVSLAAVGQTPTGKVTVRANGKSYAKKLSGGKAKIKLKKFTKKGKQKVVVKYAGDKLNKSVKKKITIKVVK
ncbi:ExeM/NucH family extracellular endonuclease [Nocardioides sp. JQ2195]|uniref:ExeM/NucH family extracellular endonuclease n=1 Tax=Nocardioides sp. JQ2195 TaxID=2592334 RepID=UPI00143E586D|nr:ExeM/NucH family extracellular endonuclease [Nocardioides sp. JQ2195]QIX27014.1 ExeM/NucH family extracellular endonuclease [Nocardioides sp. JQ2195]